MSNHIAEEFEVGPVTVEICYDTEAYNPYTEWDMASHLITWHRNATFSNDKPSDFGIYGDRYDGWYTYDDHGNQVYLETAKDMGDYLASTGVEVMPVYLYEHSGMTISTGPFSDPWDSGQVGFVFMTREDIIREISNYNRKEKMPKVRVNCGLNEDGTTWARTEYLVNGEWTTEAQPIRRRHVTKADREKARDTMRVEIETLDQYLTGQVYGYVIKNEDGDVLDSCWGFFGEIDYCISEAKAVAEGFAKEILGEKAAMEEEVLSVMESELGFRELAA